MTCEKPACGAVFDPSGVLPFVPTFTLSGDDRRGFCSWECRAAATQPVNPVGTHTGPWTFEQALTHMKAGGKVRQKAWLHKRVWVIVAGEINEAGAFASRLAELTSDHLLALDWEPVA